MVKASLLHVKVTVPQTTEIKQSACLSMGIRIAAPFIFQTRRDVKYFWANKLHNSQYEIMKAIINDY